MKVSVKEETEAALDDSSFGGVGHEPLLPAVKTKTLSTLHRTVKHRSWYGIKGGPRVAKQSR